MSDNTYNYYPLYKILFLLNLSGGILYGLLCAAVFTVMVALSRLVPPMRDYAGLTFIILLAAGTLFSALMSCSALTRRELIPFIPTRKICLRYLAKVAQSVAKRIFWEPDKAVRSVIKLSNEFVIKEMKQKRTNKKINKVLILLPHCIQLHSCAFKITSDIRNCRKCGKCVIKNFIELAEKYGFDIFVSTGGTIARKIVKERTPDLILAVACERDLLSGIKDAIDMPVIGILNERPNGPCYNTTVDPAAVEHVLSKLFIANV
ncbi:MAG: DUF116 domain-containing protein [Deferribacteraceae bacterium]|jgi:hypothetical protein|nr:DUF116 domain-containing protein [Deferribacteraceae bacterium]